LDSCDGPEKKNLDQHSESESEEFLMQASTLTLVPENAESEDEVYVNVVPNPTRRDSETKPSNGHPHHHEAEYENVISMRDKNCTNKGELKSRTSGEQHKDSVVADNP